MTVKVWSDAAEAGLLGRHPPRGSAFAYRPDAASQRAVSLTMPVRLASWDARFGLLPIFEMNIPEGALRERLRLAFAKATGSFDDFDLLGIVGRSQVGRLRYTGPEDDLDERIPFQSVDEILASRRDGGLFRYLLDRFATYSGVSGVQPKLLIRDAQAIALAGPGDRSSIRGATHIVKFWEPDYPELAANEYFCLEAARRCGLEVPIARLAEDGSALVIDRFDLRADGSYRGFEDFCVLNARATADKYRGSYETSVFRRFEEFASSAFGSAGRIKLFTLFVLNCVIRNGDAHLKNFGVVYDDVNGAPSLAPVYDLVTTTAYLPADAMALTFNGSTRWPTAAQLQRLGEARIAAPAVVGAIMARVVEAVTATKDDVRRHGRERPAFAEVGARMTRAWEIGIAALRA